MILIKRLRRFMFMNRRKIFVITVVMLFVASIATAWAQEGTGTLTGVLNKAYYIEDLTFEDGSLHIRADGQLSQVLTVGWHMKTSKYALGVMATEYYKGVYSDSESRLVAVDRATLVDSGYLERHYNDANYSYVHTVSRYGVSNTSYANSSTLVDQLVIEVTQ